MWPSNRFLSEYSISTLSVLFRKFCSFLHLMSFVTEEQMVKAWKPSARNGGINTWSPETLEQFIKFRRRSSVIALLFL